MERTVGMKKERASGLIGEKRDSAFELYRILLMLLIVMHHYVVNSGLTDTGGPVYGTPFAKRSILLVLLAAGGKSAINGFILIAGYFMSKKQISAKEWVKLLCEIMFYRIVINSVFWITGYEAFSGRALLRTLLPLTNIGTGYPQALLAFYLLIPFLNLLLEQLSEKMHLRLLFLLGTVFTLMGTFKLFSVSFNYVSWFCVVYLIGAYIRLHPKKLYRSSTFWTWATMISVFISVITVVSSIKKGRSAFSYVSEANTLLAVTNAVSSFILFLNLKLKTNRIINTVAASTFGVFLIHTSSDSMRKWLWVDMLKNVEHYRDSNLMFLGHIALSVAGVFVVCTLIDMLRRYLLERPLFRLWDRYSPRFTDGFKHFENWFCARMNIETEKKAQN